MLTSIELLRALRSSHHLEGLGVLHAIFVAPGLAVFCGLEEFGLVVVGR